MSLKKTYNDIAYSYDQMIQDDVRLNRFPYAAYTDMQDLIINDIYHNNQVPIANILDIGIGTGSLYERIMPEKLKLTGIDISEKMLDICRLRLPDSILIEHDILKGLPEEISSKSYDYIVVNHLMKHFDRETVKSLINQLTRHLSSFGKLIIGDIMFSDEKQRILYFNHHPSHKSHAMHYHTYTGLIQNMDSTLATSFLELNQYTGILVIDKYYESSLHFEESLIKYKSNTVKWKSNQTQKSRE